MISRAASGPGPLSAVRALLPFVVALAAGGVFPQASAAQSSPGALLDVREHVLDNGLRLLVVERPGDPRVR